MTVAGDNFFGNNNNPSLSILLHFIIFYYLQGSNSNCNNRDIAIENADTASFSVKGSFDSLFPLENYHREWFYGGDGILAQNTESTALFSSCLHQGRTRFICTASEEEKNYNERLTTNRLLG